MLSQVIRLFNRQTLKTLQTQNCVKRFYSNQDLNEKTVSDDNKEYNERYYQFVNDFDETTKVYQEYYKRYYDNFKNKFDNKSSDRQTDSNNDRKYNDNKNNERFKSNSYSFSECKYHLLTLRLLEKVGYIGAAIVVGLHFESPIYYSRQRAIINSSIQLEANNDLDNCSSKVCGECKYCSALLSKLRVLSAPIRKSYVFSKSSKYLEYKTSNITEITEEKSYDESHDKSSDEIGLKIKTAIEETSDPIDDICRQMQTASIDYIDRLNNMLGISLIQTDPDEAMRCWRSSKTSSKALFNMGVAFERGLHSRDGIADLKQAFDHYLISASMGHKLAVYNLSLFYLYGKGDVVGVDHNRAEALLRKAAQLGVKPAQEYIKKLEQKRRSYLKSPIMRSSASAPNLLVYGNCFESHNNNENLKKNSQYYTIVNKV